MKFLANAFIRKSGTSGLFWEAEVKLTADYSPPHNDVKMALRAVGYELNTIRNITKIDS